MTARPNILRCPFCLLDARDGYHGSNVCNRELAGVSMVSAPERAPLCQCRRRRIYKGHYRCQLCRQELERDQRRARRAEAAR